MKPLESKPNVEKTKLIDFDFKGDRATIGIFSTTVALTTACIYLAAKIQTDNYILPIFKTLCASFFIILLPQGYARLVTRFKWQEKYRSSWLKTDTSLSLFALIILTLAGTLVAYLNLNLFPLLGTIGIILALLSYIDFFQNNQPLITLKFLIVSVLLGGWFAATLLSHSWRTPLLEEWLAMGRLPFSKDQLFHASVANTIATYGFPSTGLDGIPYLSYHFASHWIFAQLSSLLNLNILQFYQLGYAVIFIPFLLHNILLCSLEIRRYFTEKINSSFLRSDLIYWSILLIAYATIIPEKIIRDTLPKWGILPQSLHSESYILSIVLLFVLLSMTLHLFRDIILDLRKIDKLDVLFLVVVFPLLVGSISLSKISTGLLLLAAISYFFLRLKLYRYKTFIFTAIVTLLIFAFVYSSTAGKYGTKIRLFGFVKDYIGEGWQPFFLLFHLFWSWLFIILKLKERKIKTLVGLKKAFLERQILDIEFVFIFAFIGLLPGALLDIANGSAFFFSEVQTWISLSFILANLPLFTLAFRRRSHEK